MSHRFWLTLALSLAAVVLLSQTSSAEAQSFQRPGTKLTPTCPTVPGSGGIGGIGGIGGGENVQIIIIVVVTTPDGEQQQVRFTGRNYQEVLSRVRSYAASQRARGNSVRFLGR
ncbi:MAG: hypothetical protein L0Z62_36090 [Gemmataceae bacterium]|nr:hypothetical protein [Gemmataceae bacterium]